MSWSQRGRVSFSFSVHFGHRSLLPGQRGYEVMLSDIRKDDFVVESLGWQKQFLATHVSPLADVVGLPSIPS